MKKRMLGYSSVAILLSACGGGGEAVNTANNINNNVDNILIIDPENTEEKELSGTVQEDEHEHLPFGHKIGGSCEHTESGITGHSDYFECHEGYAVSYNYATKVANWVSIKTNREQVALHYTRSDNFRANENIPPEYQVHEDDYIGSGYDRGHLAAAATVDFSFESMDESFLMTNIAPMTPAFNRGIWKEIEEFSRGCTEAHDEIVEITGPIYRQTTPTTFNGISVPDAFFKIIYSTELHFAMAFVVDTNDTDGKPLDYLTSVNEIELLTSYDFLTELTQASSQASNHVLQQAEEAVERAVYNFCTDVVVEKPEPIEIDETELITFFVTGLILDQDGNRLENADVTIGNVTYKTGGLGIYQIKLSDVVASEAQNYTISASLDGYESVSVPVIQEDSSLHNMLAPELQGGAIIFDGSMVNEPNIVLNKIDIAINNSQPSLPSVSSNTFTCGTKKTCGEMSSCSEAKNYLNICGVSRLDGDKDGVPCESICKN